MSPYPKLGMSGAILNTYTPVITLSFYFFLQLFVKIICVSEYKVFLEKSRRSEAGSVQVYERQKAKFQ